MQPLQFSSSGTLVNSGGQVFQIQLQPNTGVGQAIVTNTTAAKYHPPQSTSPVNSQTVGVSGISPQDRTRLTSTLNSMVTTQNQAPVTNVSAGQTQHSIIINSNGVLSSVQPGGTPIIMGQMVAQSGGGTAGTPMIIQQQGGGGPMLLLRPNAPLQTTPTLVPIAAQPGQFIVQQGGQQKDIEEVPPPQVITSQPPPTTTAAQKTFDLGNIFVKFYNIFGIKIRERGDNRLFSTLVPIVI